MSSESMKHWKVSLFFVISLMLVVGLFAETAEAQTARVTVSPTPTPVKAGGILSKLSVTYTVTGLASGATSV